MSRKVINITHSANKYDILSQTPKNYHKDNYFLRELQDKVDAEWDYRPNRVDVEYEDQWGKSTYSPLEVVVQSVLSEKGQAVSNDVRNIVFRNILDDRFNLGNRFRFSEDFDLSADEKDKNIWLVINLNKAKLTSSVIIERCNGTLGSTYVDDQGITQYHYEPVIQSMDLTAVNFMYNQTLISPQSQLVVVAQHNEFTRHYKINQRFIIGYDKIYRVKAINKFYSKSTNNPQDVGLIRMYLEVTEDANQYDDFVNRIAYQGDSSVVHISNNKEYNLVFSTPQTDFPTSLHDGKPVTFTPAVKDGEGNYIDLDPSVYHMSWDLENLPKNVNKDLYVSVTSDTASAAFTCERQRIYLRGSMVITVSIDAADSPSGEELSVSIALSLSSVE